MQPKSTLPSTQSRTSPASLPEKAGPEAVDKRLEELLTQLLGSKPKPVWKDRWIKGQWDGDLVSFTLPDTTPEVRAQAADLVRQSLTPMTPSECFGLLGEMKLTTASRPEQGNDLEALLKVYQRKMQNYPRDVVRHVLTTQPDVSKWWPTWRELKERLDVRTVRRLAMLTALTAIPKTSPTTSRETAASSRNVAPDKPQPAPEVEETEAEFEARKRRMLQEIMGESNNGISS